MFDSPLRICSLIGLLAYFGILLAIVAREKKNTSVLDYFFAGRSLPFWALSITFIASWWGAGSAIETADLAFHDGLGAFWYYGVPVLVATLLMTLGARRIRRVAYLTQGKMMAARYSPLVAKMLAIMVLIFMVFTAASQMVGIGKFFGQYMGMGYEPAVLVGTAIVLLYSLFGGFRGVVLTDIIQFVLLLISALLVFFIAYAKAGGWGGIEQAAQHAGKTDYMSLGAGMQKYFAYVLTFGLAWCIQANIWQRISAARHDKAAQQMTAWGFIAYIPLYLIVVLTGMAGLALFGTLPEGGVVSAIVSQHMPPLLGALVFVGISAAIMSTMDSLINTAAMTWTLDIHPMAGKTEAQQLRLSRYATLGVTLTALLIALQIRSILEVSWLAADVITTGAFVPLVLGFLWRRGTTQAALASMLTGLAYSSYNLARFLGADYGYELPAFWQQGSTEQVIYGLSLSLVVYVGVSLLTRPHYEQADAFIEQSRAAKT